MRHTVYTCDGCGKECDYDNYDVDRVKEIITLLDSFHRFPLTEDMTFCSIGCMTDYVVKRIKKKRGTT